MTPIRPKLEQSLGWIILALLLAGCLLVLLPFVSVVLWGVILSFACWPLFLRLSRLLRGNNTVAAGLMALAMICVTLLPFVVVGLSLGDSVNELAAAARHWAAGGPSAAPAWVAKLPLVGRPAADYWESLMADRVKLMETAKPMLEPVSRWLLSTGVALGLGLAQLALSILIAFFLFRDAGNAGKLLAAAVERIGGARGRHLLTVAGNSVRGVVYGILGTALVQAVMAGIGFLLAGVPGAPLLAMLTFFLSVIPFGTPLVWLPAAAWLFSQGSTGWGIFLLVWGLGVSSVDNFVKPWIISQGSAMPFLLIFFGVVGGALTFGFIGVFIGPTLLAVGYRIVTEWGATHSAPAKDEVDGGQGAPL